MKRTLTAAAALVATLALTACSNDAPADLCRNLASDTHGSGDTQFTEVTLVRDYFVKGTIGAYVNGDERTVGHWECSTESGEPVITFYSPAT